MRIAFFSFLWHDSAHFQLYINMLATIVNDILSRDSVFWFSAFVGTGLFVVQFLLNLIGFDSEGDVEGDGFNWFSKQSLTGFVMMFGWVGLACRKELALSEVATVACAIGAGVITMVVTGLIFRLAKRLRSQGHVFRVEDAVGKEASVYQRIPRGGVGKITISLQNLTHEIDARAGEEIESFTRVRVVKTADEKTVVVEPYR